jgi:hypothetical protein
VGATSRLTARPPQVPQDIHLGHLRNDCSLPTLPARSHLVPAATGSELPTRCEPLDSSDKPPLILKDFSEQLPRSHQMGGSATSWLATSPRPTVLVHLPLKWTHTTIPLPPPPMWDPPCATSLMTTSCPPCMISWTAWTSPQFRVKSALKQLSHSNQVGASARSWLLPPPPQGSTLHPPSTCMYNPSTHHCPTTTLHPCICRLVPLAGTQHAAGVV